MSLELNIYVNCASFALFYDAKGLYFEYNLT